MLRKAREGYPRVGSGWGKCIWAGDRVCKSWRFGKITEARRMEDQRAAPRVPRRSVQTFWRRLRKQDRHQLLPHKARDERTSRGSERTYFSPLTGCLDSGLSAPGRVNHEPFSVWASSEAVWGGWGPANGSGRRSEPSSSASGTPSCLLTPQALSQNVLPQTPSLLLT